MSTRIALVGGGTGGHIYPLIAVAQELLSRFSTAETPVEVKIFGDGVSQAAKEAGLPFKSLLTSKWRRYFSFKNFTDILKIPFVFLQSIFYFWTYMPDVVFAKGGYSSVIPIIVAKFYMIPCVIHESDAIPGKANLLLSKFAKKIFTSFEAAIQYFPAEKTETVGIPIRTALIHSVHSESLAKFEFPDTKPIVFIFGGSQGAKAINNALIEALPQMTAKFNIIHQTGIKNKKEIDQEIERLVKEGQTKYGQIIQSSYKSYSFLNAKEIGLAYSAADVVVTRGGASAIFEAASLGKPIIIIPIYESASGHQLANAREASNYGAIVVEEPNLTPHLLIDQISHAHENRQELGKKILGLASPNSASYIAQSLIHLAAG